MRSFNNFDIIFYLFGIFKNIFKYGTSTVLNNLGKRGQKSLDGMKMIHFTE